MLLFDNPTEYLNISLSDTGPIYDMQFTYESKRECRHVKCILFAVIALNHISFECGVPVVPHSNKMRYDSCVWLLRESVGQNLHLTQFWGLWHGDSWWSPVPHGRPEPRYTAGAAAPERSGAVRPQGTCCSSCPLRAVCGQDTQPDGEWDNAIRVKECELHHVLKVTRACLFPGVMEMLVCM